MRVSVSLKLIILPCVVYATWLLTSSILAEQLKKPLIVSPTGSKVVTNQIPEFIVSGAPGFHPKLATMNWLDEISMNVQGNTLIVHAAVNMMSRKPGPFHLWRLKVTNLDGDVVVSDVPYVDQRFQIPRSGTMRPTFDDTLELPAGKYKVLIALYRIPDGIEVQELLLDDQKSMASEVIGNTRTIEIH